MVKILINLLKKISRHATLRKNCIMMNACHCYPRKWTFFSENLFSYFKSLKASPWYGLKKHFFPKNEERKCHLWRSLKTSNEILKVVFIRLRKIVSVNKNRKSPSYQKIYPNCMTQYLQQNPCRARKRQYLSTFIICVKGEVRISENYQKKIFRFP